MRQRQHKSTEAVANNLIYEDKTSRLYDAFNKSKAAISTYALIVQKSSAKFSVI